MTTTTGTYGAAEARRGDYEATFARAKDAAEFRDRLAGDPKGFYVQAGTLRLNRKGGRKVYWACEPARRLEGEDFGTEPRWYTYWVDLAETVGYYGSTFGEYPFGAGKRTAYLNGLTGQATM